MKVARWMVALASVVLVLSAHGQDRASEDAPAEPLATTDPELNIYRVSGVSDSGSADSVGVATTFHCSSYSSVSELLRIVIRNFDGTVAANDVRTIFSLRTLTVSTHGTAFTEDLPFLSAGTAINQGSAQIKSTTMQVFCSAMIVNAASPTTGTPLHMVRFNPKANTQE